MYFISIYNRIFCFQKLTIIPDDCTLVCSVGSSWFQIKTDAAVVVATRKSNSSLCDWTPGPDNEIWINLFSRENWQCYPKMPNLWVVILSRHLNRFTPFRVTGRVHNGRGQGPPQFIAGPYMSNCGFGKTDRARFFCTGGGTSQPSWPSYTSHCQKYLAIFSSANRHKHIFPCTITVIIA